MAGECPKYKRDKRVQERPFTFKIKQTFSYTGSIVHIYPDDVKSSTGHCKSYTSMLHIVHSKVSLKLWVAKSKTDSQVS